MFKLHVKDTIGFFQSSNLLYLDNKNANYIKWIFGQGIDKYNILESFHIQMFSFFTNDTSLP